jgi:aquaporin Z
MVDRDWVKLVVVEFLGTFALIFAGVGAIIQTQGGDLVAIGLAHGLAIGLFVAAAGHITGGVYNPALAVGLVAARRLDPVRGAVYIVAQLAGGVVAAWFLTMIYPDAARDAVNLGVPAVGEGFSTGNAFFVEIIMTFFLMFVVFGVAIDHRTGRAISGLAIGLTITMDIYAGGAVSGAIMNPARAFGPALVEGDFGDHWIWWVAPIVGAVIAALLYNDVLLKGVSPGEEPSERIDPEAPRAARD